MPVTYFKVKPESAMYKNFFIENTERKKLKKHISEFMKNHFGNGKHEVWTTLYPSLVMTLSSEKAKELSHQLCKGTLGDSQYVFKGNNGDRFYRFKKSSKTYKLWKDEVMAHINEDNLRANAFWRFDFPNSFYADANLQVAASGDLYGTYSGDEGDELHFPKDVTVISEAEYQKAFQ